MPHSIEPEMTDCIEHCLNCHRVCIETSRYCLQKGGPHAEAGHVSLLWDCAEICATSADFMLRRSPLHSETCATCSVVCQRCAESCERMGSDDVMRRCAEVCRACSASCSKMSAHGSRAA